MWNWKQIASIVALAIQGTLAVGQVCQPEWTPLGSGMASGGVLAVRALHVFDDGTGPALYAGGQFTSAGGTAATNIAKWDGTTWTAVGGGVTGTVFAMTTHNDGTGPALFVSGSFTQAGGSGANRIAKWNGTAWSTLSSGMNGSATMALASWNDGTGPALFAGGNFTTAGGVNCYKLAKWDGTTWSPLGGGVGLPPPAAPIVNALAVFDDGTGPSLFITGQNFTTVDNQTVAANRIVKWDGTAYTPLMSGLDNGGHAMTVFNDGTGAALYVGGQFQVAGGVSVGRIAKWDGETWAMVGAWMNDDVTAMTVFDDGTGPALYVGGVFTTVGGQPMAGIAKWDGATWSPLGTGMTSTTSVNALASFNGSVIAGGGFANAGGLPTSRIAKWECNPTGACCLPSGACSVLTEFACATANGVYNGDNTTCETIPPCTQPPTGACCLPTGCVQIWAGGCAEQQGLYFGDGTTCQPNQCEPYVFEVEPNNVKLEANVMALTPGKVIVGTSTANLGAGNPDSPDYFRVKTPPAPLGIYRHRMSMAGTGSPNVSSWIRSDAQTPVSGGVWPCAVGTPTFTEGVGQPHQLVGTDRVNYWYGFGKEEEVYYLVTGVAATTAPYLAELETTSVTPADIGAFLPGEITISTGGQGHLNDTHVRIFNANLEPIEGYSNDGATINGGALANLTTTSFLRREYAPGTYYMGISLINMATSVGAPCDDNVRAGQMADFPNVAFETGSSTATDISFSVTHAGGMTAFPASRPGRAEIGWFRFVVGSPCDGDVNCDFALDGFDVETQEKAVGGDLTDYCQPDPDFNRDFALDGFDVEAVELVVGGGPCP